MYLAILRAGGSHEIPVSLPRGLIRSLSGLVRLHCRFHFLLDFLQHSASAFDESLASSVTLQSGDVTEKSRIMRRWNAVEVPDVLEYVVLSRLAEFPVVFVVGECF